MMIWLQGLSKWARTLGRLKRLRALPLTAGLVLLASVNCYGQTAFPTTATLSQPSPAQDSETLKALEIANIRLAAANEQIKLLNDRIVAKDEVIKAKDGVIAIREEQLELAKSANKDRTEVNAIDQFRIDACQQQLAKADARIYTLEHPGLLKELFAPKQILKLGGAFWLGRATK